jgi:large subunit ribosomal protein L10
MALKLKDKKAIVAEVAEVASSSLSAAVANYRGLTVSQMDGLRSKAREKGVYLRVVRNTLAKKAVKGTDFECMQDAFSGPLVLAFASEEPGAPAKLFKDFVKEVKEFEVKHFAMNGQLYGPEKMDDLSKLPNREEALALLLSVMTAPITKLVRTVNETVAQTVRVFAAVGESK